MWKASTLFLLINEDGLPPSKMNLGTAPPSPVDMEGQLQRATELCCRREVRPGEHHCHSGCIGGDDKHNAQCHHPCSGFPPSCRVPARKRRALILSWAWALTSYLPVGVSFVWLCQCSLGCKSEVPLAIWLSLLILCVYRALQLQSIHYYYYYYLLNVILCI